jgi:hypothetical protein
MITIRVRKATKDLVNKTFNISYKTTMQLYCYQIRDQLKRFMKYLLKIQKLSQI